MNSTSFHVKAYWKKVGSVSWKHLLAFLFVIFYIFEMLAMFCFHDAMYSPLHTGGVAKQEMHEGMLSLARSSIEDLLVNWTNRTKSLIEHSSQVTNETRSASRSLVILTAERRKSYLDVLLWSLLAFNGPSQLSTTSLTLLNTEGFLEQNRDLARWHKLVPDLSIRNTTSQKSRKQPSWVRRGVSDYVEALEWCQTEAFRWCLILEEDTLLSGTFLARFHETVELSLTDDKIRQDHIGMVKLFVSDHWDGFSYSWDHVKDIEIIATVSIVFACCLFLLLPSSVAKATKQRQSALRKWVTACSCSFAGFYLLCRLIGRQTLITLLFEPARLHLDPIGTTAGTVGIAFPQSSIPHVKRYLQQRLNETDKRLDPIDVTLNGWLATSSFQALRTRPSLVQHMGAYSSATYKNQGNFQELKQDSAFVF